MALSFLVVNKDSVLAHTVIIENEAAVAQLNDDEQCSDLPAGVTLYDEMRGRQNGEVVIYPFGRNEAGIPTSIRPSEKVEFASIFPNPVSDKLFLQFHDNSRSALTLEILNAIGQLQWTENVAAGTPSREVNMKPYPPGAYYIVLKSGYAAQSVKVIRQ